MRNCLKFDMFFLVNYSLLLYNTSLKLKVTHLCNDYFPRDAQLSVANFCFSRVWASWKFEKLTPIIFYAISSGEEFSPMKLSCPARHHFHFYNGGSKAVQSAKMMCLVCKDWSYYGFQTVCKCSFEYLRKDQTKRPSLALFAETEQGAAVGVGWVLGGIWSDRWGGETMPGACPAPLILPSRLCDFEDRRRWGRNFEDVTFRTWLSGHDFQDVTFRTWLSGRDFQVWKTQWTTFF